MRSTCILFGSEPHFPGGLMLNGYFLPPLLFVHLFKNHFLLLFYYSCPVFPHCPHLIRSSHPQLPQSIPTFLSMSMGHSYMPFDQTLPLLSTITPLPAPLWSLSVYSMFPCLQFYFAHQIPLIGEIIWYLPFTAWLFSLSIIFSSSIHAVTKGRSSLFLSAVQYSVE